jgi:hypothetical protein
MLEENSSMFYNRKQDLEGRRQRIEQGRRGEKELEREKGGWDQGEGTQSPSLPLSLSQVV